ncbi:MAG: hypothetical protein IT178_05800 [Acidobacteria bacterium]|nr:hypothetical protein [Acidobacteriota bacterium]
MNRGAFETLTRHFMSATLAPDVLTDAGVDYLRRLLFGVLAVLLVVGIFLPRLYFKKYTDLSGLVSAEPYLRAVQADTLFMLAVPMLLIALATVVAGPLLFPDETDYRVLTPLPISRAQLFGAKLAAVAVLVMMGIVAVTLVATFWFPLTSGGRRAQHPLLARIAAHAVASVAACVFAAAATMAAQGLVLVLAPQAWQRRVAAAVQGALAVLLLLSLPVIGRMSSMDVTHVTVMQSPLMWMPPSWFLGFERWLLDGAAAGGYARAAAFAGLALTTALAIVAASYAQLYRSAERLAGTTGADRGSTTRLALRSRLLAVLPLPPPTLAIVDFVLSGLARSRLHQMVFVLAVAGGIAALVGEAAAVMEGTSYFAARPRAAVQTAIAAPLLVALTVALGLRAAWRWPLDRGAAWVFHLTDDARTRADVLSGVSVCFSVCALVAAMLTAMVLQPRVLGSAWWLAAILTALAVLVFVESLLIDWNQIPYACTYLPGKHLLAYDLGVFAARYFVLVVIGGNLIRWCALSPARTLACVGVLLAVWAALRRERWQHWGMAPLAFEDDDPAEVSRLKIAV